MNYRVLLLGSALLIFTIGCQPSPCDGVGIDSPVGERLEPFRSTEGRFTIGLPSRDPSPAPAGNEKAMKEFKWLVINRGQYQVTYYDYDFDVERSGESQKVFDKLRDSILAKRPGQLEVDKELTLSGHPGREIRIKDEGGTHIQRLYLVGPRLYTLAVSVPRTLDCGLDDAINLLDTFALTGENSAKAHEPDARTVGTITTRHYKLATATRAVGN